MPSRFGQGLEVDRNQPHIFHRDYWALRVIRGGVADFVRHYREEMRGGRALDFGAGDSPYGPVFAEASVELLRAELSQVMRTCSRSRQDGCRCQMAACTQ